MRQLQHCVNHHGPSDRSRSEPRRGRLRGAGSTPAASRPRPRSGAFERTIDPVGALPLHEFRCGYFSSPLPGPDDDRPSAGDLPSQAKSLEATAERLRDRHLRLRNKNLTFLSQLNEEALQGLAQLRLAPARIECSETQKEALFSVLVQIVESVLRDVHADGGSWERWDDPFSRVAGTIFQSHVF